MLENVGFCIYSGVDYAGGTWGPLSPTHYKLHPFHYIVGGVVVTWLVLRCCSDSAIMGCRCPATVFVHFHIKGIRTRNSRQATLCTVISERRFFKKKVVFIKGVKKGTEYIKEGSLYTIHVYLSTFPVLTAFSAYTIYLHLTIYQELDSWWYIVRFS